MKCYLMIAGFAIIAASCNTGPKAENRKENSVDTAGFAAYQAQQLQEQLDEGGIPKDGEEQKQSSSATRKNGTSSNTEQGRNQSTDNSTGNSNSGGTQEGSTGTSTSTGTEKKGWSKTAKGAVIGGVTGAAAGAVINKKNRGAGAVIGGVVGAGAGAVVGNEMDKKDGRH